MKSLIHLARFFKLSEYVLAFILMSFATSIPELFVGISSAVGGFPVFSFGNILGANFINITLVIGLIAVFSNGLAIDSKIKQRNFWLVFFIAFMPILLAMDGLLSRGDGLVLILSFVIYLLGLIGEKEYFTKVMNGLKLKQVFSGAAFKNIWKFLLGIVILLISSAVLVWSGKELSGVINFGLFSFGIIFVAIGTALPELVFGIRASMLKHQSMSVGASIGTIAFNSAFVLGTVSLISPIRIVDFSTFWIASGFLFIALLLFNVFLYKRSNITRIEGISLVLLYVVFLLTQFAF